MSELKDALEKALEYRTRQAEEARAANKESTTEQAGGAMREWRDVVSQRIEEAMRDGQFDNLRNKGKPLNLERNPFVPEDMEMAYNLLQNNDLPPSWITARTEALKAIEGFRTKLRAGVGKWGNAEGGMRNAEVQSKIETTWREEMRALNKRIEVVNLEQPLAHLEILKLVFEDEKQRALNSDSGM